MADFNPQNFASGIVNQTLDTLRDQADQEGDLDLRGSVNFSPGGFMTLDTFWVEKLYRAPRQLWDMMLAQMQQQQKRSMIIGPITFDQGFSAKPFVTFGQEGAPITTALPQAGVTSYEPFIVEPYVFQYIWTNGQVAGMYIGVYALTNPPTDAATHTVNWRAFGKSSRYSTQDSVDTWTDSYDHEDTDFLVEDTDQFENDDTGGIEADDESTDDAPDDVPEDDWPEEDV